jgi:hypothetical protein
MFMSNVIRRVLCALAAGSLIGVVLVAAPTTASADSGGPVALMGIDAEDGGPDGHGPVATYATIVDNLFANVTNGSATVLVLGGGKLADDDVTSFYDAVFAATNPVHAVTYAHDADVATVSFAGYGLIIVASSEDETSDGGLTDEESEALKLRAPAFAAHVNAGGGLISFSQGGQTSPYGFMGDVGNFVRDDIDFGDSANIDVTAAGTAAGLSDALDVCCWHDEYLEFPSFLSVLATYATEGTPEVAAIGGAKVLIPTGIELTPATQSISAGASCAVTATVTEDNAPVSGVTVSFSVTTGPRAGTTGSAVTDAAGKAAFSFAAPTAGVDTIGASFTDSLQRVRAATPVTCTATEVLGNVVTAPAPTPAPAAAPVAAAPAFTG